MTVENEITAKDNVSSKSKEDEAQETDDDEDGDNTKDPLTNADDMITSMRSANEESSRKIAPPMPNDDVSPKSEDDKAGGRKAQERDDDKDGDNTEDPSMNASDMITSMRSAIEESFRKIEPPMPFFTRPKQRQHWGDVQVAPHKEWGDLFFDVFYVAGAYNLGTLLREEPTLRGLFYFAACFFPIQSLWQYKMFWDSRFYAPSRDMYHAFYELCTLVVLATAVLHIRPVALLSNPEEHQDLFIFCTSICAGMLLLIGRSIEVMFLIQDEPAAVIASRRDATMYGLMLLFFAAAAIYSGIKHFGHDEATSDSYYDSAYGGGSHGESSHDSYNQTKDATTSDGEDHGEDDHHFLFRLLAGASSYSSEDNNYSGDTAMALLLAGFCANHVLWFVAIMFVIPRQRATVPMNIDYAIHRYGEWIMLMLGETVLSLLIVGVYQNSEFYQRFYCGILSISLLQVMYFRSQPHHADDHAMRRNKERGYIYVILAQLFSAALIIMGASYKMLLYEFVYEGDYGAEAGYDTESEHGYDAGYGNETAYEGSHGTDDGHRRLMVVGAKLHRWLAGSGGGALRFDKEDREQRIANLFCGSMAAVWLLNDLMILVHKGIYENLHRCKEAPVPKLVRLLAIPLLLTRVGLVAFMATLPLYATDPSLIALVGLFCIMAQVALRIVGTLLYHDEVEDDEYQEILEHGLTGEQSMAFQTEEED